jgi:hypothetical protein
VPPSTIVSEVGENTFQQIIPLTPSSRVVLSPDSLLPFVPGTDKKPVIALIFPLFAPPTTDPNILQEALDVPGKPHATNAEKLAKLIRTNAVLTGDKKATLANSSDSTPATYLKGIRTANSLQHGEASPEPGLDTVEQFADSSIVFEAQTDGLLPVPDQVYTLTGQRDGAALILGKDGKTQIASLGQVSADPTLPVIGTIGLRNDGLIELLGPGVLTNRPFPPRILRLAITTLFTVDPSGKAGDDLQMGTIEPTAVPSEDLATINSIREKLNNHEPLKPDSGITIVYPNGHEETIQLFSAAAMQGGPEQTIGGEPEDVLPEMVDVSATSPSWGERLRRRAE